MAFVHKLQRHRPWYLKLVDMSCLGIYLRRRFFAEKNLANTLSPKPGFQLERVLDHQEDCLNRMIEFARSKGARVGLFDLAFSYGPEIRPDEREKLSSIQANWEKLVGGWGQYQFRSMEESIKRIAGPAGMPVLNIVPYILQHPERYHLFLDLVHFSALGHGVVARALYDELVAAMLLTRGE